MSDFLDEVEALLQEPAREFGLVLAALTRTDVALVGDTYAILLSAGLDDVDVTYVEISPDGRLDAYNIGTWIGRRFLPADRVLFDAPVGRAEYVRAALRVVASGLVNRCADILGGDRTWLRTLRRRDPVAWAPHRPTSVEAHLASMLRAPEAGTRV